MIARYDYAVNVYFAFVLLSTCISHSVIYALKHTHTKSLSTYLVQRYWNYQPWVLDKLIGFIKQLYIDLRYLIKNAFCDLGYYDTSFNYLDLYINLCKT